MFYKRIGNKDNLEIIGIGDASFKIDDQTIGGNWIFFEEKFLFLDWYKRILDFGSFESYFKLILRRKLHFDAPLMKN